MVRTTIKSKAKKGTLVAAGKDASRDMLPRTGMGAGATFVDSASKLLASYGKVLAPLVILVVAGLFAIYWWTTHSSGKEQEFKNRIDRAAMVEKFDDLKGGMETIIAEAEDDGRLVGYAHYRHAVRTYQLLDRPYKLDQLKGGLATLNTAIEKLSENEEYATWHRHVAGLQARLKADLEFLENPENAKLLPWDHHSKADKPETRLVEQGNPIVVMVTSVGTLRIELFEAQAENAVKHVVSLFEEGFYDRTNANTQAFSNAFNPSGLFKGATVITAGATGRPIGVKLEKPTTAKEDDDVDLVTEDNPYTIAYEGDTTATFKPGSFALARLAEDPTRARTEFFIVIEPSDAIGLNFNPLGQVLDGEEGMKVARRLHGADIYYTYVEQKHKGTEYVPKVYYDGWPVPRDKQKEVPKPVRFGKVTTEVVAKDSKLNPIVVIELEKGDIVIELYEDIAPNTVANFINLIEERFYNSECEFYRVEGTGADLAEIYRNEGSPRIIQGGYDQSRSRDGYDYGIRNEAKDNEPYKKAGVRNIRGTIAMARTGELDSASTEFFINIKDWPTWDSESSPYCVFGEVIYGLDLAAQLKKEDADKDANKIKGARVIRKRDHEYIPEVKYKDGAWRKKKPFIDTDEAQKILKDSRD